MKLTGLVPIIQCQSVEASLVFYKNLLRYIEIRTREGESGLEWAYLKSDNTFIMLQQASSPEPVNSKDSVLYYYTDDIDGLWRYITAKGHDISAPEITTYGLKQCQMKDPDGHIIMLGQRF